MRISYTALFALCLLCLQLMLGVHEGMAQSKQLPLFPVGVEKARPLYDGTSMHASARLLPHKEVPVVFRVGGYIERICTIATHTDTLASAQSQAHELYSPSTLDAERGTAVQRGQMLVQLRTADYQGRVSAARVALSQVSAKRRQMDIDVEQCRNLLANKGISQARFDTIIERADAIRAREEAARALLAEALELLKDTTLFAPIDGIITQKNVERGMLAVAGSTAYTIADFSRMKALFTVPDWLAKQWELGTELTIELDRAKQTIPAYIVAMSASSDATHHSVHVSIELDNAKGLIQEGMTATLRINDTDKEQALALANTEKAPWYPAIPMSSFVPSEKDQNTDYAVFIIEEKDGKNIAIKRAVELGRVEGDRVEVLSGVDTNDTVVVLGATRLHDGALVYILPAMTE